MTKDKAAQLLNVSIHAETDEVRQNFIKLYNNYYIRLNNATTSKLQELYKEKLQELELALITFTAIKKNYNFTNSSSIGVDEIDKDKTVRETNVNITNKLLRKNIFFFYARITILILLLAIVFQYVYHTHQEQASKEKLSEELDKSILQKTKINILENRLNLLTKEFQQGKFKIKNNNSLDIKLVALVSVFKGHDKKLKKFYSNLDKTIHSGDTLTFEEQNGYIVSKKGETIKIVQGTWNGEVIAFFVEIEYPGRINYKWSGIWSFEAPNGIFNIKLD